MNFTRKAYRFGGDVKPGEDRFVLSSPKPMAGNVTLDDAVVIEAVKNFNGSGGRSFGGAPEWPVVRMQIAFTVEEGSEARDRFAYSLAVFINDYFGNGTEPAQSKP